MDYAIDGVLLLLGAVGSLAALLGETWRSKAPPGQRLTKQGRIAACCLVGALLLGLVKEHRASAARAASHQRTIDLKNSVDAAVATAQRTSEELARARASLITIQAAADSSASALEKTEAALRVAQEELAGVRHETAELKKLERKRNEALAAAEEAKRRAKADEDARFADARRNIQWVIQLDAGARKRYDEAREDMSKYEAVLEAQSHSEGAQSSIRTYGEARTTAYIEELGG